MSRTTLAALTVLLAATPVMAAQQAVTTADVPAAPQAEAPQAAAPANTQVSCPQLLADIDAANAELNKSQADMQALAMSSSMTARPSIGASAGKQVGNMAKSAISSIAGAFLPGVGGIVSSGLSAMGSGGSNPNAAADKMMSALQPALDKHTESLQKLDQLEGRYRLHCVPAAPAQ
ncbi:hypothetical protein [Allosphingosinicella vermicomposti]|uniref:hypothetical protein n=1 Tax=Allosphingosinicella vermicomposti TaxID=614671 RepID=UPI00131A55D0|nr:hypothetical protein [Allosphingosinicella vermicomposti]